MRPRRRLKASWKIDEDSAITNELGEFIGFAVLDSNKELFVSKTKAKTFNDLLNYFRK